ncbi:hypothetical protein GCM10010358_73420 [Streptomyces minutiscleroticus]|uniref:Uncharacterized protein n=1 Tax=Streptomyces minutiscleroticus TaxID=68238 RepID=A0A918P036_9ACTN|nr:hypothetical protein GCM10010358_73420 [Streptomyces minutiscleroticus]
MRSDAEAAPRLNAPPGGRFDVRAQLSPSKIDWINVVPDSARCLPPDRSRTAQAPSAPADLQAELHVLDVRELHLRECLINGGSDDQGDA